MNIIQHIIEQMVTEKKINIRSAIDENTDMDIGYAKSHYAIKLQDKRWLVLIRKAGCARNGIQSVNDIKYILIQNNRSRKMSWLCNGQPSKNCRIIYTGNINE